MKGEVEPNEAAWRSCWEVTGSIHGGAVTVVGVVGGSRLRKGSASEDGRTLRIDHSLECRREVRALIRAKKQGNA